MSEFWNFLWSREIASNLMASFIGLVVGTSLSYFRAAHKRHAANKYLKFTFYRVLRLGFKERGDKPHYLKTVARPVKHQIPVYDETWAINGIHSTKPESLSAIKLSSNNGEVDAFQVFPVLAENAAIHPHTIQSPGKFVAINDLPLNHIAVMGTLINGLQTKDNWWFGTTTPYEGQTIYLVVDFTSLCIDPIPISNVSYELHRGGVPISKSVVAGQWFEDNRNERVFSLRYEKARKGDVVFIRFRIDVDRIPIIE